MQGTASSIFRDITSRASVVYMGVAAAAMRAFGTTGVIVRFPCRPTGITWLRIYSRTIAISAGPFRRTARRRVKIRQSGGVNIAVSIHTACSNHIIPIFITHCATACLSATKARYITDIRSNIYATAPIALGAYMSTMTESTRSVTGAHNRPVRIFDIFDVSATIRSFAPLLDRRILGIGNHAGKHKD